MQIGVLALQGAFAEHVAMLRRLGVTPKEVRLPCDMEGLDGLIMPGGESTVMGKLATAFKLIDPIRNFAYARKPIWGTCAGLIFMARDVGHVQPLLDLLYVKVERNAFGRQVDSFIADLPIPIVNKALGLVDTPFRAMFIRAPIVKSVGQGVDILAQLPDGKIVAVQQEHLLGTSFHPELTQDGRMHQYFLNLVENS